MRHGVTVQDSATGGFQTGAIGLVRESFGWRAARGADTRSQTTARPLSNIVHSGSRYKHHSQRILFKTQDAIC